MNHLQIQHHPQSFNIVQTPPYIYSNGNMNLPPHTKIMRPPYGNEVFSNQLIWLIDFLKKLEQDKIKVYSKPTAACPYPAMNPLFTWALQQIPLFAHFTDLFEGFEPHPHLKAFHQFSLQNIGLVTSPQPIPNYIF